MLRLLGNVDDIELSYSTGDPSWTVKPSLHVQRALAAEARDLAARLERRAPLVELDTLAKRAREALLAIALLHDQQVAMFERLTPKSYADGSYQQIGADIQARTQPLLDAMTRPALRLAQASKAANAALKAALAA